MEEGVRFQMTRKKIQYLALKEWKCSPGTSYLLAPGADELLVRQDENT